MAQVGPMKNPPLFVTPSVVGQTLAALRRAGHYGLECVALWLGRGRGDRISVAELYLPEQEADSDFFRIPPHSISALLAHLGSSHAFVAAQVHSHPGEAFHSLADDRWALVRHEGALSLVVPHFASDTTVANFTSNVAMFELAAGNLWREITQHDREELVRIDDKLA